MKLYNNLDVNVAVQDFGTSWLIVMEGRKENVELMFNAFFNFSATDDPHYVWDDVSELGGTFFTTKERMLKFFEGYLENKYYNAGKNQIESIALARQEAPALVEDLFNNHRQSRAPQQKIRYEDAYAFGVTKAENPDDSFLDAVAANLDKVGMNAKEVLHHEATVGRQIFEDGGGNLGGLGEEVDEMFAQLS